MMFPTPNLALKLTVPVAFFGYALLANLSLFTAPNAMLPTAQGLLNGQITAAIDGLYRENLPHKAPSIGVIGAARYLLLSEGRPGVVVGQAGHLFTSEEYRAVDGAVYGAALAQVARAAAQLDGLGVQLIVAPLPAKLDLMRDWANDGAAANALAQLYQTFQTDLRAKGISVVDSRPALAASPAPFLTTDTHWTPQGARTVATSIAASGTVAPGSDGFTIETGREIIFAGDLVSYITSDALAPFVGLSRETVTPYTAVAQSVETGVLDLFGGDGGGIDLVGTSYSANPNWSFAEALKLELSRDVVNHAEQGQGPFAPMAAYLATLDPLALPEVVIWEIPVRYLTDPAMKGAE
ncbi:alginate O-acetyltransferase AlgX-related protein [Oceaniglobus ichthyenteri]|uniref:alginate O-acetyltransferase AlgX-related protein n=1 Tax=Oceaniglobus ichthyenteri TaxID=2136177 RepID=UPI000D37F30C|nr:hypothetical protein [Oceaniglobus ichthyenteri]